MRTSRSSALLASSIIVLGASGALSSQEALESGLSRLASELATPLADKGVRKLAVVNFVDVRGYPSALDAFLAEELTTELFRVSPGQFTVVERRQLERIRDEQVATSSDFFDQETLVDVGRMLGLDALITGTVADLGDDIKINARAIAMQTGEVFAASSARVTKEGDVAALLRQPAGPGGAGTSLDSKTRRQTQASDVFFENDLIRLTVAGVGLSDDRKAVTVSLWLENLTGETLMLASPMQNSMGDCSISLTDEKGNHDLAKRMRVGGLVCLYDISRKTLDDYVALAPKARSTLTLPFTSHQPFGRLYSLSVVFEMARNGRVQQFSAGLANIEAPPSP